MSKRKQVEEFILKAIKDLTKDEYNVQLYKDMFKSISDKEFDDFMHKLANKEIVLQAIIPHEIADNITLKRNYSLAKKYGYNFYQHLIIKPDNDMPAYRTTHKFFTTLTFIRRTKQTIDKGLSVAMHDKQIDLLTGQVTGDSRSSRLSYPETQLLVGMGMKDSLVELLSYRGGDLPAMRAIKTALIKYGRVSQKLIEMYAEGTISTKTLKAYFNGMHIKITL